MDDNKLTAAVLGLGDKAQSLLETISKNPHYKLTAVADNDTELTKKIAKQYDCASFDDYRQLIIQNQLDCLIVAAPIHTCDEYLRMAMKKKFNILKLPPPAINFEQTLELTRLAADQKIKFAIANPARFTQSFIDFKQNLHQLNIEDIFLITATCAVPPRPDLSWLTDPKLAGGGVLLNDCYELFDQIISNFPLPQQIYSLNTNTAADRQQRLYLTEDTATVTMKFSDTLHANLIASRHIGPQSQTITVYSKEKILTATPHKFTIDDQTENTTEKFEYNNTDDPAEKMLTSFAMSILSPDDNPLECSADQNLKNMAVIESAYLSARTGFPEQPQKILDIEQNEPTEIWPLK